MSVFYCNNCGSENESDSKFCFACGSEIKISHKIQSASSNIEDDSFNDRNPRITRYFDNTISETNGGMTISLGIVLALNYIGVLILGLLGFLSLFSTFFLGIIFLIIAFLFGWLTFEVQDYNNTARIILIGLNVFGLILTIIDFDIVSLIISGFTIYVLAIHENTVSLFE